MRVFRVVVLIALIATACARGGGTRVTDDQLSGFVDGRTTAAEVIAALGPPTSDVRDSTGLRVLGYSFIGSRVNGAAFIPVVGPFAARASGEIRTVTFTFDGAGILTKHTVIESHFGS